MIRPGNKGVSLLEVLVAFVVLGIGLSVLIPSQGKLSTVPTVKLNDYLLKEFAMTEVLLIKHASGTRPNLLRDPAWIADIKLNDTDEKYLEAITVQDRISGERLFELTREGIN